MKGTNTFQFNEATMIEALQVYLDRIMLHAPEVTSVTQKSGICQTFEVVVKRRPDSNAEVLTP